MEMLFGIVPTVNQILTEPVRQQDVPVVTQLLTFTNLEVLVTDIHFLQHSPPFYISLSSNCNYMATVLFKFELTS